MKTVVLVNGGSQFPSGGVRHTDTCPEAKGTKGKVRLTDANTSENLKALGFPVHDHTCLKGNVKP